VRAAHPPKGARCMWHFNPQGLSPSRFTPVRRALLPHIFTLIPTRSVGTVIFCDPVCAPVPITRKPEPHPLGGAALYVVRTFLPIPIPKCRETGGRAVCSFFIPVIDGNVFMAFPMKNRSVGTKNRFETSDKRQEFLIPDLLLA